MFVSAYSTYINNNSSDRTTKTKLDGMQQKGEFFSSKLSQSANKVSLLKPNTPVNYISQNTTQHNKQMIELSQKSIQDSKKSDFKSATAITKSFSSNASMQSAKVAYSSNSRMFSLLKKPTATLDQTPKIDINLPQDIQDLKEKDIRYTMINTYIANDKYYQITA